VTGVKLSIFPLTCVVLKSQYNAVALPYECVSKTRLVNVKQHCRILSNKELIHTLYVTCAEQSSDNGVTKTYLPYIDIRCCPRVRYQSVCTCGLS